MLLPGEITTAEARAVLAARPAGGYGSSVRFWEARQFEGRKPPSDVAEQAGVNSRWLALTTNVTMGDGFLTAVSLIEANGGAPAAGMPPPVVVRRDWGVGDCDGAPAAYLMSAEHTFEPESLRTHQPYVFFL